MIEYLKKTRQLSFIFRKMLVNKSLSLLSKKV